MHSTTNGGMKYLDTLDHVQEEHAEHRGVELQHTRKGRDCTQPCIGQCWQLPAMPVVTSKA